MRNWFFTFLLCGVAHAQSPNPFAMSDMTVLHKASPCFEYYYCIAARKGEADYLLVLLTGTNDIHFLFRIDGDTPVLVWSRIGI